MPFTKTKTGSSARSQASKKPAAAAGKQKRTASSTSRAAAAPSGPHASRKGKGMASTSTSQRQKPANATATSAKNSGSKKENSWTPMVPSAIRSASGRSFSSSSTSSNSSSEPFSKSDHVKNGQDEGVGNAHSHSRSQASVDKQPYIAFMEMENGKNEDRMASSRSDTKKTGNSSIPSISETHRGSRDVNDSDVRVSSEGGGCPAPGLAHTADATPPCSIATGATAVSLPATAAAAAAAPPPSSSSSSAAASDPGSVRAILDSMSARASQRVRQPRSNKVDMVTGANNGSGGDGPQHKTIDGIQKELKLIQRGCGFGLHEETEISLRAAECGVPLHGPWMGTDRATTDSLPPLYADGSASRSLRQKRTVSLLSAATWLRVLAFCDLPSLAQITRVSARLHVLSQWQGLWLGQAACLGIDVSHLVCSSVTSSFLGPQIAGNDSSGSSNNNGSGINYRNEGLVAAVKDAIRGGLKAQRQSDEAEVHYFEHELSALQQRMAARSEENLKQCIDVNRTLAAHNPNAVLNGTFTQRAQHRRLRDASGNVTEEAPNTPASSADTYRVMLQQLRVLENARDSLLSSVEENAKALAEQQAAMTAMKERMSVLLSACTATSSLELTDSSDEMDVIEKTFVNYAQICMFELRIARLVLNGGFNSNTGVEKALAREMPLTLRRGVTDFGTLELLMLQLASEAALSGGASSNVKKAILSRWSAFQRFCPLNEDYYLVRQLLQDRDAATAADAKKSLSKRMETSLLRISGLIRKVSTMKDHEVLNVVM